MSFVYEIFDGTEYEAEQTEEQTREQEQAQAALWLSKIRKRVNGEPLTAEETAVVRPSRWTAQDEADTIAGFVEQLERQHYTATQENDTEKVAETETRIEEIIADEELAEALRTSRGGMLEREKIAAEEAERLRLEEEAALEEPAR